MDSKSETSRHYVMGYSDEEMQRLRKQATLWRPVTLRFLEDAGITAGMRVLDVGAGAGDVTLLLAEKVGPAGQVIAVDNNPAILDIAWRRVEAAAFTNVSFVQGDVATIEFEGDFDAIVGRFILQHLRQPVNVLARLAHFMHPEGIIGFQELDQTRLFYSMPPASLYDQAFFWIREAVGRAGLDPHLGMRLYSVFLDAGLPAPEMRSDAVVGAAPDWIGYEVIAGTVRSLLPLILKFGIATEQEVAIDTLASRLQVEIVSQRGMGRGPDVISAWTRTGS